jgi:hypothetical protein
MHAGLEAHAAGPVHALSWQLELANGNACIHHSSTACIAARSASQSHSCSGLCLPRIWEQPASCSCAGVAGAANEIKAP